MQAEIEANSRTESVTARGVLRSPHRRLAEPFERHHREADRSTKLSTGWKAEERIESGPARVPFGPALRFGAAVILVVWTLEQLLPRGFDEPGPLRWMRTLSDHPGRTFAICVFLAWAATRERIDAQIPSRGVVRGVEARPGEADPGKIGPFNI